MQVPGRLWGSLASCGRLAIGLLPLLLAAADEWPQFRGNPQLTGVAAGALPANLKLLWTYESGESIESSAAISGGSVYVGAQPGELLAIDLANRQAALEVQGAGRNRRVVSRGSRWRRLHRRFFGPAARRARRGRKGIVDLQNRGRDQVVARGGRRPRVDRLLRWQPVLPVRARWQAALDVHHLELRARHAVHRKRRHLPGRLR